MSKPHHSHQPAHDVAPGNVIPFRPRAPQVSPVDDIEPTQSEIVAALIMTLVSALPEQTKKSFRRSFQMLYDTAPSPEAAAAVRAAARAVYAPLMAGR